MELAGLLLDVVQIAHETQLPHEEPVRSGGGGGASTIVVVAGLVLALAAVAGLVWVKRRVDA